MNKEEIRDKISSIVWHINSNYSPSGAETTIMEIIEKVQEDAYQEGFKAAEEKFTSIDEVRITPDLLEFLDIRKDRIKKELEYIKNPNRYIDVYNSYKDKSIAYPLAEYLDIKALQSGFDSYEDMLNEGLSIDYSGDYLKDSLIPTGKFKWSC